MSPPLADVLTVLVLFGGAALALTIAPLFVRVLRRWWPDDE